ncbi:MAG: hypothetical protein ACXIVQ_06295 [Acidimicrobiales bacterium]
MATKRTLDRRGLGSGVPPGAARRWSRFPVERIGPFADAIATGAPVRVDDVAPTDLPADFAISSWWVAPLSVGGPGAGRRGAGTGRRW